MSSMALACWVSCSLWPQQSSALSQNRIGFKHSAEARACFFLPPKYRLAGKVKGRDLTKAGREYVAELGTEARTTSSYSSLLLCCLSGSQPPIQGVSRVFYSCEKLEVRSSSLEVSSMPCASLSFPARFAQLKLESYDLCNYSRVANCVLGYRVELLVLQGALWSLSSVHPAKNATLQECCAFVWRAIPKFLLRVCVRSPVSLCLQYIPC